MHRAKSFMDLNSFEYVLDREADGAVQEFLKFIQEHRDQTMMCRSGVLKSGKASIDLKVLARALTDNRPVYDPNYGDDVCCGECGHTYERHFDTYMEMEPVGCKYCPCRVFQKPAVKEKPKPAKKASAAASNRRRNTRAA